MPVQPRDDLDEGGFPGAVVAEHTGDLPRVHLQRDTFQGPDVPVVLADVGQLDQRCHAFASARLRTHAFRSVASSSIAPRKNLYQSGFHCA